MQEIASDNDSGGCLTSLVRFSAVGGTEYQIAVDGLLGALGQVILNGWFIPGEALPRIIMPPENQLAVASQDVTFQGVADGSSPLVYQWFFNFLPLPGETGPALVLHQVTSAAVGLYSVMVCQLTGCISTEPVTLQLSSESSEGLDALAHDKLREALAAGSAVALQAFAPQAAGRPHPVALRPGTTGFVIFSTLGATKEPGEPNHCGRTGGASYWLPLRAPSDGLLTVSTEGSDFHTLLALYVADPQAAGRLAEVASDDNSGRDGEDSYVQFPTQAGKVYYVAVDGPRRTVSHDARISTLWAPRSTTC